MKNTLLKFQKVKAKEENKVLIERAKERLEEASKEKEEKEKQMQKLMKKMKKIKVIKQN